MKNIIIQYIICKWILKQQQQKNVWSVHCKVNGFNQSIFRFLGGYLWNLSSQWQKLAVSLKPCYFCPLYDILKIVYVYSVYTGTQQEGIPENCCCSKGPLSCHPTQHHCLPFKHVSAAPSWQMPECSGREWEVTVAVPSALSLGQLSTTDPHSDALRKQ